ncbi:uncharacterized protein LOC111089260, partial [Limulus polyphemus]|uniref:Uncharacterized protein LOC111089260 n=1 Tax=Limulus polyphemus TaxID=6850 RepID=A0ABM1TMM6_LIMPO
YPGERDYLSTSNTAECFRSSRRRLRNHDNPLVVFPTSDMPYERPSWTKYEIETTGARGTEGYVHTTVPASYSTPSLSRKPDPLWYDSEPRSPSTRFPENTAEDKSIARIAQTFPMNNDRSCRIRRQNRPTTNTFLDFFSSTTDLEIQPNRTEFTADMPILPDVSARSRKLLNDLGSAPLLGHSSRSSQRNFGQHDRSRGYLGKGMIKWEHGEENVQVRRPSKYNFPVKRILLTRDRFTKAGNGFGLEIVGGKDVPDSKGETGAYVAKIYSNVMVGTLGEVTEGDQVLEWNGITLNRRTYEEVKRIIASSEDEVEMVIRSDLNVFKPQEVSHGQRHTPSRGQSHNKRGSSRRARGHEGLSSESHWHREGPNYWGMWDHKNHICDRLDSPVDNVNVHRDGAIHSFASHDPETANHSRLPLSTSTYQVMSGSRAPKHESSRDSPTADERA